MNQQISNILTQIKQQLTEEYHDRLSSMILFGSQARNEASPDSDIDLLVILEGKINPIQEIKRNNHWITNLCLETDQLINCIYLSEEHFQTKNTSLIRNIKREGIPI